MKLFLVTALALISSAAWAEGAAKRHLQCVERESPFQAPTENANVYGMDIDTAAHTAVVSALGALNQAADPQPLCQGSDFRRTETTGQFSGKPQVNYSFTCELAGRGKALFQLEDLDNPPEVFPGGQVYLVLAIGLDPRSRATVWGCTVGE